MRQLFRPISWQINDRDVEMTDDYQFNVQCDEGAGGFDQLSGTITRKDAHRVHAEQGSVVRAVLDDAGVLYEGRLSTIPKLLDDTAQIKASGAMALADQEDGRRLYRTDDYSQWQSADSDPYGYANADKFSLTSSDGKLGWELSKGDTFNNGNKSGYVFWAQNCEIVQVKLVMRKSADDNHFDLWVRKANGPSGSLSNVTSYTLAGSNPDNTKKTTLINGGPDLIALIVEANQNNYDIPAKERFWITGLSVYGLTTKDTLYGSEVVADVVDALGFDPSGVNDSSTNVLPLDWTDGSNLDLLTYLASIEDFRCLILEDRGKGPYVDYRSWDDAQVWTIDAADADLSGLDPLPLYSQATVKYQTPGGVDGEVVVKADENPLPDDLVSDYVYDLSDRQADDSLARQVGSTIIRRYSKQRWGGTITIADALTTGGTHDPQKITAGDVVEVRGWDVDQNLTLRVHDSQISNGSVELGIEQGVGLPALLADISRGHHRRRRKRRHHHQG